MTTVLISDWLQVKVDCCRRVRVTSPAQPGVAGAYTRAGDHNGHTWYQVPFTHTHFTDIILFK